MTKNATGGDTGALMGTDVARRLRRTKAIDEGCFIHAVWLDPTLVSLLVLYDNTIKKSDLANEVMESLCRSENLLGSQFFSLVFVIFKETFNFVVFTNFQDQGWTDMLVWYNISANIYKNICELNNHYFKEFLTKLRPRINLLEHINPEDLTLGEI
jgi:hypothetical protein